MPLGLCTLLVYPLTYLCTPVPEHPDLYITSYNWEWGGGNCNEDCGLVALNIPTEPWMLDLTAACPSEWLGRQNTTVITIHGQDWWCIDAFGKPEDRILWWNPKSKEWMWRIDLAMKEPYVKYVTNDYRTRWEPLEQLYEQGQ